MGGMMDATGGWIFLWTFLVLALAVAGDSIVAARVLSTRHSAPSRREESLQGKVELED
jgi:hypothetical protein